MDGIARLFSLLRGGSTDPQCRRAAHDAFRDMVDESTADEGLAVLPLGQSQHDMAKEFLADPFVRGTRHRGRHFPPRAVLQTVP